ncbi:MAG: HD domain-containing protein [Candidatus Omnitrophica bacterium]|nr:HD domain-containing protein [Candidatus Omnitrophota bacterium]
MKKNKEELFHNLIATEEYQKMKKVFLKAWGKKTVWLEIETVPQLIPEFKNKLPASFLNKYKKTEKGRNVFTDIYTSLHKVKKSHNPAEIKYDTNSIAYIFPFLSENYLFGYILIADIQCLSAKEYRLIFQSYLNTAILKMQNDMELTRLYETIQPRTAALSTIHTIHRLISTTLDLKDLLPRLARLSLQVMKVRKCSIYLTEKNRRCLKPMACVTSRGQLAETHKIKFGDGMAGQSAKKAIPVLTEHCLAMPLIEEDVLGVIVVADKIDKKPFNYFDQEILSTFSEQAVIAIKNAQLNKQREKVAVGSIKSLTTLSGTYRQAHIRETKFKKLITDIARELNLSKDNINALNYAVKLHDVGKIGIPEKILQKNSRLTSKEFKMIKQHPTKSASILKHLKVLEPAIPIILYHREKYDGSGYPEGLKGKGIPIGARILSIVDAFDAMITKRPYRRAKSVDQAIKEINKNSGTQFDPKIVKIFLKVIKKTKQIKKAD